MTKTVYHFLFYYLLWIKFRARIRNLGYKYNRLQDISFFVESWLEPNKNRENKM